MTDPAEPILDALMARLARGDREVFTRVFEALWEPVRRLCRAMLRHEADAEDAAQEAMKKIAERASDYDPARPAMPWALAIAAWECRTIARRRLRRKEIVTPEGAPRETPSAAPAPDDAAAQRELVDAAMSALGALSDLDREALVATFWDEAATASGATLRKRRERALDRLRRTFWRLYGVD